jgi:ABC-type transporter Mla subunit MlaD
MTRTVHPRVARAARRDLILGIAVIAVTALIGWISTVAIDGLPWSSPYRVRIALPPGAPLLTAGDEVRVAGERVGQVSSVTLAPGSGRRAVATLALSSAKIGPGAAARIRPLGLAGAVYVDLEPGQTARPWPSGRLLSDTTGGVQLTDVISGFDAAARRALDQTLTGYGTGLAGRGVALNDTIAAAPGVLRDLTAVLDALRPRPGVLAGAIGSATTVAGALADGDLAGLVGSARHVLDTTSANAAPISATIDALPGIERTSAQVLPSADVLLSRLTTTAHDLGPGVAALARALPAVGRLEANAPAIAQLERVASTAAPALSALTPAFARLAGPAAGLTPLSSPIAELAPVLIPYEAELKQAPLGFTRWGNFTYDFGTGAGHRAVRFSMVFTCALARDPYPLPGEASKDRRPCK